MIPFELYSISPSINDYGHIYSIPNYYTPSEMSSVQSQIQSHMDKASYNSVPLEAWPSLRVDLFDNKQPFVSEKSQWLLDNWSEIHELTYTDDIEYYRDGVETPVHVQESARGTGGGNRLYPSHNDRGALKLLTILVPLVDVGCPTRFHGRKENSQLESRVWCHEWALNNAYMFRPSERSYHSYQNTMGIDRWISNINLCGRLENGQQVNDGY